MRDENGPISGAEANAIADTLRQERQRHQRELEGHAILTKRLQDELDAVKRDAENMRAHMQTLTEQRDRACAALAQMRAVLERVPPAENAAAIVNAPHPSERGIEKKQPEEVLGLFKEAARQMTAEMHCLPLDITVIKQDEYWIAKAKLFETGPNDSLQVKATSDECESRDFDRAIAYALTDLAVKLSR